MAVVWQKRLFWWSRFAISTFTRWSFQWKTYRTSCWQIWHPGRHLEKNQHSNGVNNWLKVKFNQRGAEHLLIPQSLTSSAETKKVLGDFWQHWSYLSAHHVNLSDWSLTIEAVRNIQEGLYMGLGSRVKRAVLTSASGLRWSCVTYWS